MGRKLLISAVLCLLSFCGQGRADFKYSQTSQITGGAVAGVMKFMGHFSKQASQPSTTTTYIKGAYLRSDNADGSYRIIDLNRRRMIEVNPAKQAYQVTTFEQLREMAQKMQQAFSQGMHKESQQNNTQISLTPKIDVTPTGRTQTLLGQNAQEVKTKISMQIQATDAQKGTQSGSFDTDLDSWVAPSVSGYQEVTEFYRKMAVEIGWTPGSFGMDPRMSKAMVQLYKGGKIPRGLPMLQVMSLVTAGQAPSQGTQQQQQQTQASSSMPDTPNAAAMKALGGMFGHFGHKKKQKDQDQDQHQTDQSGAATSTHSSSNALMEITMRVVSYSADSLDGSLFQIPASYTQQTWQGPAKQ